jgi:putative ABC transport system ATP-binding protein
MEPILRTDAVTKIYESGNLTVKAVDQVSIEIHPGEFVALVGPSGSGKTTMLAMLAGLLNATQGTIHIDGYELGKLSEKEKTRFRREKIGFTFQANNLIPYLTALENVELMLRLNNNNSRFCREEAKKLLARLGLSDRLNNLPKQLSGGQQQRVAIARALIHDPSLVLADEPTAALDTERAYQVVQIFSELIHEQKRAGIMVTHDLRLTQYVDRVIQMVDGKILRIIEGRDEIDALAGGGRMAAEKSENKRETPDLTLSALHRGVLGTI